VLLRRVGLGFTRCPDGFHLDVADTATALGLGAGLGRNSPWWRTVGRLVNFGYAAVRGPESLAVRRAVAPLPEHLVRRLPASLQRTHAVALAQRAQVSARTASNA
jgi:hypothetical protein